jgi:RNA polymerase sigma factor (TIGR02999 family)
LRPTALVHEAYLRLAGSDLSRATIDNRVHFFAVAAQAMRRILVEHARRYATARRPSPVDAVPFVESSFFDRDDDAAMFEVLAVNEALETLREAHPRQAHIVELRYFGGLEEVEVAEVMGLSRRTVARDWRVARMLLGRLLTHQTPA